MNRREYLRGFSAMAVATSTGDLLAGAPKTPALLPEPGYPIEPGEKLLGLPVVDQRYRPGVPERYGARADCHGNTQAHFDAATDSTRAIQAAVDYTIFGASSFRVELLCGGYKTTDTIHLGYGGRGFNSVVFEGQGYRYRGADGFSGTALFPVRTDRPAINVQGARGTVVRGIAIVGRLAPYLSSHRFCELVRPNAIDDTKGENWDDPGLGGARCDARYAPYAGIAVDAYFGVRPAVHYPDVRYPDYAQSTGQYGKSPSSDVRVEDCYIGGFTVALVNQPCDADGNGDFTSLSRVSIDCCKWGVSVGNSQSRNVSMRDVKMNIVHTCLTNRTHGRQVGRFGGLISDLSVSGAIRVMDFGGSNEEPVHFANFYAESLWRIGDLNTGNSNEGTVLFTGAHFGFHLQTDARGHPARTLAGNWGAVDLQFQGCYFTNYKSVVVLDILGISFEGCFVRLDEPRIQTYEQIAHNALVGGVVTRRLETPARSRFKSRFYNLDTGTDADMPQFTAQWTHSNRTFCIPFYCERVRPAAESSDELTPPHVGGAIDKTGLASLALDGAMLSLEFRAVPDGRTPQHGPEPGDVIYDDDSGSVFFVHARNGNHVTAALQNNYRTARGVAIQLDSLSTTHGTLHWRNARIYTPSRYLAGDLESSAAVGRINYTEARAAASAVEIAAGDQLLVPGREEALLSESVTIRALDSIAGTMSLSSALVRRSAARHRLAYFIRKPPPNV